MKALEAVRDAWTRVSARIGRLAKERPRAFQTALVGSVLGAMAAVLVAYFALQPTTMSVTRFVDEIAKGRVTEATVVQSIGNYDITAVISDESYFIKAPSEAIGAGGGKEGTNILQAMAAGGVEVELVNGIRNSLMLSFALAMPFFVICFLIYLVWQAIGGSNAEWMCVVRGVRTRFADVAGADEAKAELAEVLQFMGDAESYAATKARIPKGVLLCGPPGTGKTMLAKALAGEAAASFIAVSGSDFRSMWLGSSARRVRSLFAYARANKPCIVFIDEFDAIGAKRSGGGGSLDKEVDGTLNQLLVEMDGFASNEGVVVVAATNLRANLDPAVTRPGRLDRIVEVGLPDQAGRVAILNVHAADRPLEEGVDLLTVARGTPGFSGAELGNLVNEAAVMAARRASRTIGVVDFEAARNKLLMGLARRTLVLTDAERRLTAIHEAGHAVAACLCPHSDPVHKATIVPHGAALGMVVRLPERDRVSATVAKLRDDLTVLMAGRAAERVLLGADSVTTGASSDIEQATAIARAMVTEWGLSDRVGMVRVTPERAVFDGLVEEEVRAIVHAAFERAVEICETRREAVEAVADALIERETLDGREIRKIVAEQNRSVAASSGGE